jgi:hypothetical protein
MRACEPLHHPVEVMPALPQCSPEAIRSKPKRERFYLRPLLCT